MFLDAWPANFWICWTCSKKDGKVQLASSYWSIHFLESHRTPLKSAFQESSVKSRNVPTVGRKGLKLKRKYFMHSLSSEFANSKAFGLKRLRAYKFNIIKRESYGELFKPSPNLWTYPTYQLIQFKWKVSSPLSYAHRRATIHMYILRELNFYLL